MKLNNGFNCVVINVLIVSLVFDVIEGQGRRGNTFHPRGRGHRGNPFRGRRLQFPGTLPSAGRQFNHGLTHRRTGLLPGRQTQNINTGRLASGEWKPLVTEQPLSTTSPPSITTEKQITQIEIARLLRLQNIRSARLQDRLGAQNNTSLLEALRGAREILKLRAHGKPGMIPGKIARGGWKPLVTKAPGTTTALPIISQTTTAATVIQEGKNRGRRKGKPRKGRLPKSRNIEIKERTQRKRQKGKPKKKPNGTKQSILRDKDAQVAIGLSEKEQISLKRTARLKAMRERRLLAQERRKQLQELRRKAKLISKDQPSQEISTKDQAVPITTIAKQTTIKVSSTTTVSPTGISASTTEEIVTSKPTNEVSPVEGAPLESIGMHHAESLQGKTNVTASLIPNVSMEGPNSAQTDAEKSFPHMVTSPSIENDISNSNAVTSFDVTDSTTTAHRKEVDPKQGHIPSAEELTANNPDAKIGPNGEAAVVTDPILGEPRGTIESNTRDPLSQNELNKDILVGSNVESNPGVLLGTGTSTSEFPNEHDASFHGDFNVGSPLDPVEMSEFPLGQAPGIIGDPQVGSPLDPVEMSGFPLGQAPGIIGDPHVGSPLDPEVTTGFPLQDVSDISNTGLLFGPMDSNNQGIPLDLPINTGTPLGASDIWFDPALGSGTAAVFEDVNLSDFFGATDTASVTNTQETLVSDVPIGIQTMSGQLMPVAGQPETHVAAQNNAKPISETETINTLQQSSNSVPEWSFDGFALAISRKLKRPL